MSTLHLLLAHATSLEPYVPRGIPAAALRRLPPPRPPALPGGELGDKGAAPDDLRAQRWGLVVPEGQADRAQRVAPLVRHREAQQDAPALVYEAPRDLDAYGAVQWMLDVYQDGRVPVRERPRYLLLLGDLSELSEDLQHALATQAFVGRLSLEDEEDHARYCAKVIASENAALVSRPRLLLHARQPGDASDIACRLAVERMLLPCLGEAQRAGLAVADTSEASGDGLMEAIARQEPAVLITICHGLGAPDGGWTSPEEQRRLQGALSLGGGRVLSAEDARHGPHLPGGIWFMHACFSAATPAVSAYETWMAYFPPMDQEELREVLDRSRPCDGKAFLGALPAALLANPEGPLAVIGHSDVAWVDSFFDPDRPDRATALRVLEPLQLLAEGRPAGVALSALLDGCRQEEQALLELCAMESLALGGGAAAEAGGRRVERLAQAWLGRQDLRGYLLLGDPAARVAGGRGG